MRIKGCSRHFYCLQIKKLLLKGKRGIVIEDTRVKSVSDIGKTEIVEDEQGQKVKYMDQVPQ